MNVVRNCLLLTCLAFTAGCNVGPYYEPEELRLPNAVAQAPVERVLIGGFGKSLHLVSHTQSGAISTTREMYEAEDVSPEIATQLRQQGIPAKAIKTSLLFAKPPANMRPGDVFVTGRLRNGERLTTPSEIGNGIVCIATMGVYGVLTPLAFPIAYGSKWEVVVQATDHEGNFVLKTNQELSHYHRSMMMWPFFFSSNINDLIREVGRDMLDKVASALGESLRSQIKAAAN